jgi:hypothetical protein
MDEVHHTIYFRGIVDLHPFYVLCLGIERTQSRITCPKEMREIVIQDVCSSRFVS